MSNLLRGLATAAKAAATAGLTSYEDAAKKGRQQYNREQSQRYRDVGSGHDRDNRRETPDQYNMRKAKEMLGVKEEPKKKEPAGHSMDRFSRGP
jgi:hypothetical protein